MKKTLSLVLALVMVLGLMAVPVRADFSDTSKIEYNEAVEVLTGTGIINGFEDGSFKPEGTLTREQAAKIIAYMLLDAKNADALKATTAPFADVAASRWSAGYIAYAVNEGIVAGRGDNKFDPEATVTGYEFAKMLLVGLGYDAGIEQFTGASWSVPVAKLALNIGLFDGNEGANYTAALTREEAALYAFNTLQANLVDYANRGTVINNGNGQVITVGASKAEAVKDASDKNDTIKTDAILQFAERYFKDLTRKDRDDAFGRPSNVWKYSKKDIGTYSQEADVTYTEKTKQSDIYKDINKPSDGKITIITDGAVATTITAAAFNASTELGGNGTIIEVYETDKDNDEYSVVVINTYAAKVIDWNEANKNDDESIELETITAPNLDSIKFETTDFDQSDADDETVVFYTAAKEGSKYVIQDVTAAEQVTGVPTGYTVGKTVEVDDTTTYKYNVISKDLYNDVTMKAWVSASDDVDVYLDANGYVIYVDADATSSSDYAYLVGIDKKSGSFSTTYIAKLVLPNGETSVVDLKAKNFTDDYTFSTANDGTLTKGAVTISGKSIVTYTANKDSEYTLGATTATTSTTSSVEYTKGTGKIKVAGVDMTANTKTVFYVKDGKNYNVYTGIKNSPSIKSKTGAEVTVLTKGNAVVAVYVSDANVSSSSKDDFIMVAFDASASAKYNSTFESYYTYKVVGSTDAKELHFAADLVGTSGEFKATVDTIYVLDSYSVDKDGLVTGVDIADAGTDDDGVYATIGTVKAEDGLIGFGVGTAAKYYAYDDDLAVYKVNSDAEINKSSLSSIKTDITTEVTYILDEGVVTHVFFLVKD